MQEQETLHNGAYHGRKAMQYTIGEIARMFGNTVGAIRFYEDAGLVKPGRDAAGNRFYTQENIMELFYLRKYCSYGLKIREVAEYFEEQNTKEPAQIEKLLEEKRRDALQQAIYYEKSAQWISQYTAKLSRLDEYAGALVPMEAPDYCVLLDEPLVGKTKAQQAVAQQWIAAAPMSRISRLVELEHGEISGSCTSFIISMEDAHALKLPMPPTARLLKGASCLYTIERIQAENFAAVGEGRFLELIGVATEMGHRVCGPIISNLFFTHVVDGVQYKYFEVFLPVDAAQPLLQPIG